LKRRARFGIRRGEETAQPAKYFRAPGRRRQQGQTGPRQCFPSRPARAFHNDFTGLSVKGDFVAGAGWRVLLVWECALRGPARQPAGTVVGLCEQFLRSEAALLQGLRREMGKLSGSG